MSSKKIKPWPFTKMHTLGNDAIILDCTKTMPKSPTHAAKKLCNRRLGIGADMLLLFVKSRVADLGMKIFNPDGSEAEMCGNGIRMIAEYSRENNLIQKKELKIETKAGVRQVKFKSGKIIEVDMGTPMLKGKEIPVNLSGRIINRALRMDNKELRITCVGMGNPHCIVFQEDIVNFPVGKFGPALESFQIFPRKVNASFVNVVSNNEIQVRTWERGVGETLSCGSAACAAVVAAVLNGYTDRRVTVVQPGGKQEVEWNRDTDHVILSGPVEMVFKGEVML